MAQQAKASLAMSMPVYFPPLALGATQQRDSPRALRSHARGAPSQPALPRVSP